MIRWAIALAALAVLDGGCLVERFCYGDDDCGENERCSAAGRCAPRQLPDLLPPLDWSGDGPLPDLGPLHCPSGMVVVAERFCIDRYEASRPDADESSFGSVETHATSREHVLPWRDVTNALARAACAAAGKRLCTPAEWQLACHGPAGTVYAYGDSYEPTTCNGIDAFGGGAFALQPTGSFEGCTNGWGVFDLNGNLWEHTANGSGQTVRGGAYNCLDSATLHRCDYVPGNWTPTALGFRCCADGSHGDSDLGPGDGAVDGAGDGAADAPGGDGSGGDAPGGEGGAEDAQQQ